MGAFYRVENPESCNMVDHQIMSKPSPRNARALRLMDRSGAIIKMGRNYGKPNLGDGLWNSEATAIGKQIGLERRNVIKMLAERWIIVFKEPLPDERWGDNEYIITSKGRLSLASLNAIDFKPQRSYFSHDQLKDILRNWYRADGGYIFLNEMPLEGRRLDCYALGIWERTRYVSIGFEIKVTRSDLLSDLRNEYKQIPAMKYCHQFYYVTTKGLAQQTEFPDNVGLIEIWRNKSRHILIDAPFREIDKPDWKLIGSITQRALKEYYIRYDWFKDEWVGQDREIPTLEEES